MANKNSFTAEEWAKVRDSVLVVGLAVSMAEPSGLFGMLKEGFANARDMLTAKNDKMAAPLIQAVIADLETPDGRTGARAELKTLIGGKSPAEAKAASLAALAEAAQIIDAKAEGDGAAYKAWLAQVARHVAESASEGGFLGFGGTQVTDNERATLGDISRVLGVAA